MNKTEQHSKTGRWFRNAILVFERNSQVWQKDLWRLERNADDIFCGDDSHLLAFDDTSCVDLASHEGQWLPHRDASVQHKSKETRLGEGQERNQEEGGGLERGKGRVCQTSILEARVRLWYFWQLSILAGTLDGVQHLKGDAGKYQQDIPGARTDGQGHCKRVAIQQGNEWTDALGNEWVNSAEHFNAVMERQNVTILGPQIKTKQQAHTFSEWCQECGCIHLDEVRHISCSRS